MSDTPRVLRASHSGFRVSRKRRNRSLVRIGFVAFLGLSAYLVWISRDTHTVSEFVPESATLRVIAPDPVAARDRALASRVWESVPRTLAVASVPEMLDVDYGVPPWVRRNLLGRGAVFFADDVDTWQDAVVVTRMTRVGCWTERLLRRTPASDREWAGGLNLRYWEPADLFYAARGRTLLVARSRDALIRALTLDPDRRATPDSIDAILRRTSVEDFYGTMRLAGDGPVRRVRFAGRIDASRALVRLEGEFREATRRALEPSLAGLGPRPLVAPYPGPLGVSVHLDTNVKDTWAALGEMSGMPWLSRAQWRDWETQRGSGPASALARLLAPLGPAAWFTWLDVDLNEMAPTPVLAGGFAGDPDRLGATLDAIAAETGSPIRLARDGADAADLRFVSVPFRSGPAAHPTGVWHDGAFRFSTDSRWASRIVSGDMPEPDSIPREGNILIRVAPEALVDMLVRTGRDLVRERLLEGYDAQSFEEDAAVWLERAAALDAIELLGTVTPASFEVEARVVAAP